MRLYVGAVWTFYNVYVLRIRWRNVNKQQNLDELSKTWLVQIGLVRVGIAWNSDSCRTRLCVNTSHKHALDFVFSRTRPLARTRTRVCVNGALNPVKKCNRLLNLNLVLSTPRRPSEPSSTASPTQRRYDAGVGKAKPRRARPPVERAERSRWPAVVMHLLHTWKQRLSRGNNCSWYSNGLAKSDENSLLSRLVIEIPILGYFGVFEVWGYLATSGEKSDVILLLSNPDFLSR